MPSSLKEKNQDAQYFQARLVERCQSNIRQYWTPKSFDRYFLDEKKMIEKNMYIQHVQY